MNKKLLIYSSIILAIILVVLALIYWFVPAGSLPSFFPGFEVGSTHTHFKHGLAAILLAGILGTYVWFSTGKKLTKQEKD